MKLEKGITLIALIITIVVLLILAVVTIGSVQESGIIGHAQKAKNDYTIAQEKEQIGLALSEWQIQKVIGGKSFKEIVETALEDTATVSGNEDGPLTITMNATGNKYKVTYNGEITKVKEGSLLEKYILGSDLAGRPLTDIIDNGRFIDDATTEGIDETQTIGANFINVVVQGSDKLGIIYFESQGVTYKFGANVSSYVTDASYGVAKIYEPEEGTRVGKTVKYDNKIWTILYDDSTNGLQMVSYYSLLYKGNEFYLGSRDSSITDWTSLDTETEEFKLADSDKDKTLNNYLEKSIYSYNNAIDTLNTACESLVTPNSSITDVRCVGSNPTNKSAENEILYTSEELEIWPIDNATYAAGIGNRRGKSTDLNYVSDFDRMAALGISIGYNSAGNEATYWLASRFVEENLECNDVRFKVRFVGSMSREGGYYFWKVDESDFLSGYDYYSLRPVVSLKSDVQLVADPTGEADYTF